MKPLDIEEINDAIEMLKKFEADLPSVENVADFPDAISMLNDYLTDYPETPHKDFINNQKIAYTRRLLQFLKSISSADFASWTNVAVYLFEVKTEIEKLFKSNPELKKDYDDFYMEWKNTPELASLVSSLTNV